MISWRQKVIVELELRMHMTNLCLATISREEGKVRECKDLLVDKVCELIAAAEEKAESL